MTPFRSLLVFLLLFAAPLVSYGQGPAEPGTLTPEQKQHVILLRGKLEMRMGVAKELEAVREKLAGRPVPTAVERAQLEEKEKDIAKQLESLDAELHREMTGVTDKSITPEEGEVDLQKQAKEVLKPALDFLNDMMEQPRKMEEVRRGIEWRKKQIEILTRAIAGLDRTLAEIDGDTEKEANKSLREEMQRQREEYVRRRVLYNTDLADLEPRMAELRKDRQGFGQYAAKLWSGYVLHRLLNLLLAAAAFTGVLLLLRWIRRWFSRRGLRKRLGASPFVSRLVDVLFHVVSVISAIFAAFLVLWISGDWLLLTLAMLLVAGLILLSRHTLPRMYEQVRILMNLGGVREGERVIWHGLPWQVRRLHFQSELYNPSLTGGLVHLPLREMSSMLSRSYGKKERWFPTEEGDWVVLNDGTVGRVVLQTPENVQMVPVGGSFKTYTTADFLNRTPRNLSHNFRVESKFSLDYRHTAAVLGDAQEILATALREGYRRLLETEDIIHVSVELMEAASSSLDLLVLADFSGKAAPHYQALFRLTQRLCMETASANGWKVPFHQVVVHPPAPAEVPA